MLRPLRKRCGRQVDVFNMTQALVLELPGEAAALTHDSFHWSEVVNLLKAQLLLNDIAAVLPAGALPADAARAAAPLRRRGLGGL